MFFLPLVFAFLGFVLKSYLHYDFDVLSISQIMLFPIFPLSSVDINHIDIKKKYNADLVEFFSGVGKRVAAYMRVSTWWQAKHGRSLDVQVDNIKGMVVIEKPSLLISYTDGGLSGRSIHNRKIPWIIKLAEDHLIDELWACDFTRLGRNALDLIILFCTLAQLGVAIRTLERVYTSDNLPDLIMVVMESVKAEKENIERSTKANDSKKKIFKKKNGINQIP